MLKVKIVSPKVVAPSRKCPSLSSPGPFRDHQAVESSSGLQKRGNEQREDGFVEFVGPLICSLNTAWDCMPHVKLATISQCLQQCMFLSRMCSVIVLTDSYRDKCSIPLRIGQNYASSELRPSQRSSSLSLIGECTQCCAGLMIS